MADLIEIGVEVRTNSVRSATKEVDSLGKTLKSAERSASAFVDAFARQERQVSKAAIANKAYSSTAQKMYNEILKIDTATKSASASASVFAANLEKEAKAAAKVAKENERLKSKFVEGHTAMNIYTKELNDLAIARKRDIITAEQQKAAVAQLNAQMSAGTGVFATAGGTMQQTARKTNQLGVLMQQSGYQVGDFAVQVQSGTNVMVAFGQQATQLIGTFAMLAKSTKMIALFSGLGIAVPILTAIGAAFLRTREANEEANEKLKSTDDILKDLKSSVSDADKELRLLHSTFDDITKIEVVDQIKQLEEQIDLIKTQGLEAVTSFAEAFGAAGKQLELAEASVDALAEGKRLQIEQLQAVLDTLIGKQKLLEIEEGYNDLLEEQNDAIDKTDEKNKNVLTSLRQRAALAQAFIDGGEDAAKAEGMLQEKMQLVRDLQSDKYDFSEAQIGAILQQVLETERLEQEVQDVKDAEKAAAAEAKQVAKEIEEAAKVAEKLRKEFEKAAEAAMSINIPAAEKLATLQSQLSGYTRGLTEAQVRIQTAARNAELAAREAGVESALELAAISSEAAKVEREIIAAEKALEKFTKTAKGGLTDADEAAEKLRKELEAPMVKAIDSVSNAFGDFIANGLKDFKSFASSIVSSFKSMIAQMIATAARNKIMLSMGLGGTAFAEAATAGNVAGIGGNAAFGPIGSFMGSFAGGGAAGTGLLGGIGSVFGTGGIGLGGSFGSLGTLLSGGSSVAAGGAGFAATLGAAIPAIAAVAVVVGLFTKKTKLLDSGLRTTVEGFDVAIETFNKTQTSRLFGLLKGSKKTSYEAASAEVADPLIEAIGNMQQSIIDAAGTLGIGANAFDDFSYQFKLSLKGLTEEEQLQKINEEITKMGDSFASLTGHFETMNELLEAANQRMQLQNRLDQLLGNNQAILARQREAELKAMHELNRPLAQLIYNLEDAQFALAQANQSVAQANEAVAQATQGLRQAIDAEKGRIQASFASLIDGLTERLDVANEAMGKSRNIYEMLSNALSSRQVSDDAFAGRRSSSLAFLRGGDFSDEQKLEDALSVVSEPSEQLFGSFVDYARDFGRTSAIIDDAKSIARTQLDFDERQVLLLQQQIEDAQAAEQAQLAALDKQFEALTNVNSSVLSVKDAVGALGAAIQAQAAAMQAQAAAQAAASAAAGAAAAAAARAAANAGGGPGGGSAAGVQAANAAGQNLLNQLGQSGVAERASDGATFQKVDIRGTQQLLDVAKSLGVQTSGQTGQQIQQAISNASNLGVSLDNATRAKGFAQGGYHTGGIRMVGERGPEIEATGPSRIFSHNQTASMFKDPELVSEVRNLRSEVSGLRSEQRQMQASNVKYVKRNYDINRKWDTDGLPATRTS